MGRKEREKPTPSPSLPETARSSPVLNLRKQVESKVDETERKLRDMIRSGALPAGQWLKQQDLALSLNTSITPVREALRRLEVAGLVVTIPYQGARVSDIPPQEIREIYLVHALLQSEAVRLYVPLITDEEIRKARKLNEQLQACVRGADFDQAKTLNEEMHLTLCGTSHFPFLGKMIRFLWKQNPRDKFRSAPDSSLESVKQHRQIIEAVSNRQAEAAAALVKEHFVSVGRSLVERS
ncbi:MAG: GntR family transcriptional regulator [Deltaproteobacteria bacterium]|nr:GntR family transcriptional regulator [Deltaproteobacteria bacterium]